MHIKEFLDSLAEDRSSQPLPTFGSPDDLSAWQTARRAELRQAWGLPNESVAATLGPPDLVVTGITEFDEYRIERIFFESLDHLVVTANLYVPNGLVVPAPAIVYLCGHAPTQKIRYQDHARRFAQLGFVTMIVDTIQYGEVPGIHHGLWERGRFQWVSRGYSPVAVEAWNAHRAIDALCARSDVDPARIGVTGISGGGAVTWWVAAIDDRVRAIASSSGTGSEFSYLADHTVDMHCDCFFPNNPFGWPLMETYLLAAPKPALIVAAEHDHVFTRESVEFVRDRLAEVYERVGDPALLELVVTDSDHRYTEQSRRAIFAWMLTHVAGEPTTPADVADVDDASHADSALIVLAKPAKASVAGAEADLRPDELAIFRTTRVDEWFVPRDTTARSDEELAEVIFAECLGWSESRLPAPTVRVNHRFRRGERVMTAFSFASESLWRLRGQLRTDIEGAYADVVVVLRSPNDGQSLQAHALAEARREGGAHAVVDVRGSGDTAWHPSLLWHLRRAARVLGRTIAGMQIIDALNAVRAVRELSGRERVELAAEGDLAAVAIVCGLLDTGVDIVVRDAPETFDSPGSPDGTDRLIELTGILKYTDLPDLRRRLTEAGRLVTLTAWERER